MSSFKPVDHLLAVVFAVGLEKLFGGRVLIVLQGLQSCLGISLGQFEAAVEGDGLVPLIVGLEIKRFHFRKENLFAKISQ